MNPVSRLRQKLKILPSIDETPEEQNQRKNSKSKFVIVSFDGNFVLKKKNHDHNKCADKKTEMIRGKENC